MYYRELTGNEYSVWGSDVNGKSTIQNVFTMDSHEWTDFPSIGTDYGENKFTVHSHDKIIGQNTKDKHGRYHSEPDIASIGTFGYDFSDGSKVSKSYVVHDNNVYRMDFTAARASQNTYQGYDANMILDTLLNIIKTKEIPSNFINGVYDDRRNI